MTDAPTHPPAAVRIKEALEALDELHEGTSHKPGDRGKLVHAIRLALGAAQQEADAWEAVHQWRKLADAHSYCAGFDVSDGYWFWLWLDEKVLGKFTAETRLEALTKAAEFCRKELGK
jgi:hypothetical protein